MIGSVFSLFAVLPVIYYIVTHLVIPKFFCPNHSAKFLDSICVTVSFSPIIRHSEFSVLETGSYANWYLMNSVTWSSLFGSSTDFFYVCISTKLSLPVHKSFQTWKFHEVIPFTGEKQPSKLSNLTRQGVHWKGMTAMAQLPQNCYAGGRAGGSCCIHNIQRTTGHVHSSIQTTVVLAECLIPATIPSKFKIKSLQPLLPRDLTAHFLYKFEVVEIEYRSFQRERQPETVEIHQQSLFLDNKKPFPWPKPTRDTPKDRSESEENNWISCKKPTATCIA